MIRYTLELSKTFRYYEWVIKAPTMYNLSGYTITNNVDTDILLTIF